MVRWQKALSKYYWRERLPWSDPYLISTDCSVDENVQLFRSSCIWDCQSGFSFMRHLKGFGSDWVSIPDLFFCVKAPPQLQCRGKATPKPGRGAPSQKCNSASQQLNLDHKKLGLAGAIPRQFLITWFPTCSRSWTLKKFYNIIICKALSINQWRPVILPVRTFGSLQPCS